MKRTEKGQILPLTAMFLSVFVLFIAMNGERWLGGIRKMEAQRETDSLVLLALNEQARALNAIAALNEGLKIAAERGVYFGQVVFYLEACAATLWGAAVCGPALARLTPKIAPFYRKLNRLGKELARQQDRIAAWGAAAPGKIMKAYNARPAHVGKRRVYFSVFPQGLPIRRAARRSLGGGLFAVPPPYVLEKRFFSGGNRLTAVHVSNPRQEETNAFDPFLKRDFTDRVSRPSVWTLSEAEIDGGDLFNMEFRPILTGVQNGRRLWDEIGSKRGELAALGFSAPPAWREFEGRLAH